VAVGEEVWQQIREILPNDSAPGDNFGTSLAIDADTLVVGSPLDGDAGTWSGSAYVFRRDTGGAGAWGEAAKLTAPDGVAYDQFGFGVAASGDGCFIGARDADGASHRSGVGYVFDLNGIFADGFESGDTSGWTAASPE
jgi:FG-GAP repeat